MHGGLRAELCYIMKEESFKIRRRRKCGMLHCFNSTVGVHIFGFDTKMVVHEAGGVNMETKYRQLSKNLNQ